MSESPSRTFVSINQRVMSDFISSAKRHLIFAAPGITSHSARAIVALGPDISVRVIIDADAEAIRLGFGDEEGLRLLSEKGVEVRSAPGLRIGVLAADDRAWVYAPTPEIILEQPKPNESNAVEVDATFARQILFAVAPDVSVVPENRLLDEPFINTDTEPEIGTTKVIAEDIEGIKRDLSDNPPQRYDAARKVRVYQGYLQFVELNFKGSHIAGHKIRIPNGFLNVNDVDLSDRIRSTCNLIQDKGRFSARIQMLEYKVKDLRKKYLRSLGERYKTVVLIREKALFDQEFQQLSKQLEDLQQSIIEDLRNEILTSRSKLTELVVSGWRQNPPPAYQDDKGDLDEKWATEYVQETLARGSPAAEKLLEKMQLTCDYKDVTIEMMNDDDFMMSVIEKFPDEKFEKLYSEQETIGEKKSAETEQGSFFLT